MQEELAYYDVVRGQHRLKFPDRLQAVLRRFLVDEFVYTRREHIFVVRSIKDADHAARRHRVVNAPQEIMLGLCRTRHFERGHVATLRVYTVKNAADRTVLAAGVHALKHDEKTLRVGVDAVRREIFQRRLAF